MSASVARPGGLDREPASLSPGRSVLLFVVFVVTQLLLVLAAAVSIAVFLVAMGRLRAPEALAATLAPLLLPVSGLASVTGGLLVFWLVRRSLPGPLKDGALSTLGWSRCSMRAFLLSSAVGASVACIYLFVLLPASPGAVPDQLSPVGKVLAAGGWALHCWAALAVFVAPPVEEFVFRGVLYSGLTRGLRALGAGVVVTALFVASHYSELPNVAALVAVSSLGVGALMARVTSGSLLPAVTLHASYNLIIVLATYGEAA